MIVERFYIDGEWRRPRSTDHQDVVNPASATVVGRVPLGNHEDADDAVLAARSALDGWATLPWQARRSAIERIIEVYARRRDELADAISLEMGAPRRLARGAQAGAGLGHLEDFVRVMEHVQWERPLFPGDPDNRILMEAKGVAVLITPWNWPMNQICLKVGAALAAGCTMVLKPSEFAPFSATIFAEILDEAGLPAGVFNLVYGTGPVVGQRLVEHADVSVISLTGSTRAGAAVAKAAADTVKRTNLELGGKGANLIFGDCDVKKAAEVSARHMFRNSGQSCNAPSRILAERGVYDQVVKAVADVAQSIKVGDPQSDATEMGPVVNQSQYQRIRSLIAAGISEGARLVAGGPEPMRELGEGYFIRPTVLADVDNSMTVVREEIFGPVLTIQPFDTEDEAIALANDTVYGLAAYAWTCDPARLQRLSRRLRSGMVRFNGTDLPYGAPFGGFGQSGIGREGGVWGIEEYLEVKAVSGWVEAA